jgi:hypothetical protein
VSDPLSSEKLAHYIEATDGLGKPWLLAQLRLAKLKENREHLTPEEYADTLANIHADLMQLGQWWKGREREELGE